jgi:HTH-type transcriptional regulator/antitoxin HigA
MSIENFALIKDKAKSLFAEAAFIGHIYNEDDYAQALALMDELIESYDEYRPLIEVLSSSIERWESTADELIDFNTRNVALNTGVAVLRALMDQHHLNTTDFQKEIGGKSMVSMILSGSRQLNKEHIEALSRRFKISPALFLIANNSELHRHRSVGCNNQRALRHCQYLRRNALHLLRPTCWRQFAEKSELAAST